MRKITSKINKNYLINKNYKSNELNIVSIRALFDEFGHLPSVYLYLASFTHSTNMYYSQHVLRCFLTGRARATIKKFMLSRMLFKKISLDGFITGLKKAS